MVVTAAPRAGKPQSAPGAACIVRLGAGPCPAWRAIFAAPGPRFTEFLARVWREVLLAVCPAGAYFFPLNRDRAQRIVEATSQAGISAHAARGCLLSLVVPCYNEAEVLPRLFERVTAAAGGLGCDWEVVCVDDGSSDGTLSLLAAQHRRDARWRVVSFARNFGHQTAVSAGMSFARGDAVAVLDADLQDPPEELGRFLAKWREGFEVVYAVREKRKENLLKRACYWIFYRLMARMVPFELPLDAGDFCLMDRRVVNVLNAMPERTRFVRGLRAWAGFKQTGISYERHARAAGAPKYTFGRLFRLAWDGLCSFSTAPLRMVSGLGLWISGLSLAGIVFTLVQRLFATQFERIGLKPAPGFATIVISILFLGGIQLFCLGILGEYIGRIYEEVKGRPKWVIKETLGVDPGTDRS